MEIADLEKEFEGIMKEYGGIITKICYSFSSDPEEFKDLRQEVMYHIWKGLQNFRNESKLSTWIYRISFNSCISYQRKEKKYTKVPVENILMDTEDTSDSKLADYLAMHNLIKRLSYEDRALILMWLDDLSYEDISNLTGLNRNTIASRLKRIKEKLVKMNS